MKKELENLLEEDINEKLELEFLKLIKFIDAAILQGYSVEGQEKTNSLVNNFLNMRNYLLSEITIHKTKIDIKEDVLSLFDKFIDDHDLNLSELEEIRIKKKENASAEEQLSLENLLETDLSTSSSEEEN